MSESAQEVLSRFLFWRLGITQASIALGYTDELLTALDAAGLVVVPKGVGITADGHEGAIVPFEPTDEMLRAAHDTVPLCDLGAAIEHGHQTGDWTKRHAITKQRTCAVMARDQYVAMLAAAGVKL